MEAIYPIIGPDLIQRTLEQVYSGADDDMSMLLLNFMLAISLAFLSLQDPRLQTAAEAYFGRAISDGLLTDRFVRPTRKSLQLVLLLCVYSWICPGTVDIWRLLGHASRMCLDIIEMHGSDKTDSSNSDHLFRTLYTIETEVSIYFGRPHPLPGVQDAPAFSPSPGLMAGDGLSIMVYNLARLQGGFHRDMIGKTPELTDDSWMEPCLHDMTVWLEEWNVRVESLFVATSPGEEDSERLLKLWGEFQQCEALLLAKSAMERRGQVSMSSEDEYSICKRLLQAADCLCQSSPLASIPSFCSPAFLFPLTWTRAHGVFNAAFVLLEHVKTNRIPNEDVNHLLLAGIRLLTRFERHIGHGGFVSFINHMQKA